MTSEIPNVFIVILNWNGWHDTVECIRSLYHLDYPNYEIIVVDNGSTDDSVNEITHEFPDINLIKNQSNLGFAAGNNVGIRHAIKKGADYIWLLNNDTVVDQHALSALIQRVNGDAKVGMCGSKLIYSDQPDTIQALAGGTYNKYLGITKNIGHQQPVDMDYDVRQVEDSLEYIVGASILVSRKFIEEIGLLSEDYFLYYEEIDWAMRAKSKFELGFAPGSVVYHKEGASTAGNNLHLEKKSRLSDYYQIKNRLKFTYKFFPYCLPTVYLTVIYAIFVRIKRRQWGRIPMIIKLMFIFNR